MLLILAERIFFCWAFLVCTQLLRQSFLFDLLAGSNTTKQREQQKKNKKSYEKNM